MRSSVGRCRRTTASLLAAVFALAIAAPAHASDPAETANCPFADAQPGEATQAQLASSTVCLLNVERAANGLGALTPSAPLATTAQKYSEYMVSDEHFAHIDEDGHNVVWRVLQTDPSLANRWVVIGENLGWGTLNLATPRAMMIGWMNSPTHRDNILYPKFDQIGVGVADGAPVPDKTGGLTYATVFGKVTPPKKTKPRMRPAACIMAKHAKAKHAKAKRAKAKRGEVCVARAARVR